MDFNEIIDNSIVIIPSNFKSFLRNYKINNFKLNFKVYTKEDLKKELYGKKSEEIIGFLLNKTSYTYDFIDSFLDYYFSNALIEEVYFKRQEEGKLGTVIDKLFELKLLLDEAKLVKVDPLFKNLFINKKVVIIGYSENDIEIVRILEQLNVNNAQYFSLDILPISKNSLENIGFLTFETKEDELHYNLNLCANLLEQNKDITLVGNSDLLFYLKLFSKEYNLKFDYESDSLIDLKCVNDLIINIDNDSFLNNVEKYILDEEIKEILKELNTYFYFDNLKDKASILRRILKKQTLNKEHFTHEIKYTSNLDFDPSKTYILSNCTSDFYPNVYVNKEMCDEETKMELGLTSTYEINRLNKEIAALFLQFSNLVSISSFSFDEKGKVVSSFLLNELDIKKEKPSLILEEYSSKIAKLFYSKENQVFQNFYINSDYNKVYKEYFKELESFDNTYNRIKEETPFDLKYSYSSLNEYFECPFKYYLKYILKIDSFEDTFSTKAGNFAHEVLKNIYKKDFDFNESVKKYLPKYEFKDEEEILLHRFIRHLDYCHRIILDRVSSKNITKTESEKDFEVVLDSKDIFKGKVDSIVETDNKNLFIIDYKSGEYTPFNEGNFNNSLGLQLPSYVYLIKNSNLSNKDNIAGLFIQPINFKDTYEGINSLYKDNFKLQGRILDEIDVIDSFDDSYKFNEKSLFISDLKLTKGKFSKDLNEKLFLTREEIDEYNKKFEAKIKDAISNIKQFNFNISPCFTPSDEVACKYCKFKCICFVKDKDKRLLIKEK